MCPTPTEPPSEAASHHPSSIDLEPAGPPPTLYIFGAGEVSIHVAAIASQAGFKIAVIDDRPGLATAERFPAAVEIYTSLTEALEKIRPDSTDTYLLIATRTHEGDLRILEWALRAASCGSAPRYTGMIGKKRKVISVYKTLEQNGIALAQLESVHAPVGLDIGALTPAEIAVSITAELIAVRRNSPHQNQNHKSITFSDLADGTP